jgi:hypothetical protein
MVNDNY